MVVLYFWVISKVVYNIINIIENAKTRVKDILKKRMMRNSETNDRWALWYWYITLMFNSAMHRDHQSNIRWHPNMPVSRTKWNVHLPLAHASLHAGDLDNKNTHTHFIYNF